MTRDENPIGYTVSVLSKFGRLVGVSGIHTGTAGIGKMAGSIEEDITAARLILNDTYQGRFLNKTGMDEKDLSNRFWWLKPNKTTSIRLIFCFEFASLPGSRPLRLQPLQDYRKHCLRHRWSRAQRTYELGAFFHRDEEVTP